MYDLVVIGAGLSGLQAAYSAQQAGLSVIVLEARDRVGGKVWSVPLASGRGVADLGATWINDKLQKRVWTYVGRLGLDVVTQRLDGNAVVQVGGGARIVYRFGIGPEFSSEEKENFEFIRDHIQAASLRNEAPRREDDNVTLDQYIRKLGAGLKTVHMVNLWTRVMHGIESNQESAAWFIDYCRCNGGLLAVRADDQTGGNYMRVTTGAQEIPKGLARLIGQSNIRLCSPVHSVTDHRSHVTVATTTGKAFNGRKCIISIPSTLYQDLSFKPPLPASLRDVTDSTMLGHYNKAIVCYDKPWWRDLGHNGFLMSYTGPVVVARDTSVAEKRLYSLTCFINGAEGERWTCLHPHNRRRVVLEQLAKIYDVGAKTDVYQPIEFFEQIWKHEPYSKGALAPVTALGHYTKSDSGYGKPVGNLHFVGTEFSREWKGYMEGALCSGEHGAREVIKSLEGSEEMVRSML